MYLEKDKSSYKTEGTTLRYLQSWMQQQLLEPGIVSDTISDTIEHTEKLSAQQHLAIYQRSYIARLRDCMIKQFPVLAYALGADLFQDFTDIFLCDYPSQSYTLADLGKSFSFFLEETRPDKNDPIKESWPDFMIELAQFEYQINIAFDEKAPMATDTFLHKAQDLRLTPLFYLFKHTFPITTYYKDFINGGKPMLPFEKESYTVIVRRDYRLGLFELKEAQYLFLKNIKEGNSIEDSKQFLKSYYSLSENTIHSLWMQWKSIWMKEGFFE